MIHLHILLLKALMTKSISSLKVFSMHICMNRMHPELVMIQYWVPWVLHSHLSFVTCHISLYVNVWMNRLYLFSSGSLTPVSQMLPICFTHNILIGRVTPSYLITRNRVSNRCNFLVLRSEFSILVGGSFLDEALSLCLSSSEISNCCWLKLAIFTFMNAVYDSYDWRTVDLGQKEGMEKPTWT